MFPDLTDLPAWAQVAAYLTFAVAVGGALALSRLGLIRGRRAEPGKSESSAEIRMVAIDHQAVTQLAAAAVALNGTLVEGVALARQHLEDLRIARDEAEREALRREGFEQGLAARPPRAPPKRKPRPRKAPPT